MKNRLLRKHWLLVGLACAFAVVLPATKWRERPEIDFDQFQHVLGLTLGEIEDLVGGPPGDYRTEGVIPGTGVLRGKTKDFAAWWGNHHAVVVYFDGDGRAVMVEFSGMWLNPPWLAQVRSRLGI